MGGMDALLVIDLQNDFCPGGALAVPDGDRVVPVVNGLAALAGLVVATRDRHPPDHGSFRGVTPPEGWRGADPPAIWPPHCVAGSPGAELHPDLDTSRVDLIVDKGMDRRSQGYSAFQDTGLAETLRARGVDRLVVAGLATDYCVLQSVCDALAEGFAVTVVEDAVRGVDVTPGDSERALEEMRRRGARVTGSDRVRAEWGAA